MLVVVEEAAKAMLAAGDGRKMLAAAEWSSKAVLVGNGDISH